MSIEVLFAVNSESYSLFCFGAIGVYFIGIRIVLLHVILIYIFHDVSWDVFSDVLLHLVTYRYSPGDSRWVVIFVLLCYTTCLDVGVCHCFLGSH